MRILKKRDSIYVQNDNKNEGQADQNENSDSENLNDKSDATKDVADPKSVGKGNGKGKTKGAGNGAVNGKRKGKRKRKLPKATPKKAIKIPALENGEESENSGDGDTKLPPPPKKTHKKKGLAADAPPSSVGLTQVAYAALLVAEAANPEMTRKQVFENALKLYARQLAYLPPLQMARLDSDSLITIAGASTKWEKSCKSVMKEIHLAEFDDEEKAKHLAVLNEEIQRLRIERQMKCRMAGIPISHSLIIDIEFVIAQLKISRENETNTQTGNRNRNPYDSAIEILSAYLPVEPATPPKPSKSKTPPPTGHEDPEKPEEKQ